MERLSALTLESQDPAKAKERRDGRCVPHSCVVRDWYATAVMPATRDACTRRRVAPLRHGVFSLRRRNAPRLGLTTSPGHVRSIAEKARQTKIKLEKVSSLTVRLVLSCSRALARRDKNVGRPPRSLLTVCGVLSVVRCMYVLDWTVSPNPEPDLRFANQRPPCLCCAGGAAKAAGLPLCCHVKKGANQVF